MSQSKFLLRKKMVRECTYELWITKPQGRLDESGFLKIHHHLRISVATLNSKGDNSIKKKTRWLGRLGAGLMCPLGQRKRKHRLVYVTLPLRSNPDLTSGRACPENTHSDQGSCWTSVKTQSPQQRKMGKVRSSLRSCYKPSRRHLSIKQEQPTSVNMKASILTCCSSHLNTDSQLSPQRKETDHIFC